MFLRLLVIGFLLIMGANAYAQKSPAKSKPAKTTKKSTTTPAPEPPPPMEEMEEMLLPPPPDSGTKRSAANEADFYPKPVINFDTTAAPADELTAEIRVLMQKTDALNIGMQFGKALATPEVQRDERTKALYERLMHEFTTGEGLRFYENHCIKIYREYFTLDEVKQINAFYDTPTGKKVITLLPEILNKSVEKGKAIADYFVNKIMYESYKEEQNK